MKIKIKKFQEGGAVAPAEAPAEAPVQETSPAEGGTSTEGGEDPIMAIAQIAVQALQAQDCEMAMQVCEAFIQLVQQAQGGGAPEEAPQGEPVYRRGGKLTKRI